METLETEEDREVRIKRLIYRANHRGIKEMDIVLGGFAKQHLGGLSDTQIDDFEKLMEEHDRDLLVWVTGEAEFPIESLREIFEIVSQFAVDAHHQGD